MGDACVCMSHIKPLASTMLPGALHTNINDNTDGSCNDIGDDIIQLYRWHLAHWQK